MNLPATPQRTLVLLSSSLPQPAEKLLFPSTPEDTVAKHRYPNKANALKYPKASVARWLLRTFPLSPKNSRLGDGSPRERMLVERKIQRLGSQKGLGNSGGPRKSWEDSLGPSLILCHW